jgi:hypothetical protein
MSRKKMTTDDGRYKFSIFRWNGGPWTQEEVNKAKAQYLGGDSAPLKGEDTLPLYTTPNIKISI